MHTATDIVGVAGLARHISVASRSLLNRFVLAALALAACGGDAMTDPASGNPEVPVASVDVQPAEHLLEVGQTVSLRAQAKSAAGDILANRPIVWRSDADAVATVSQSGLVTARGEGAAFAIATSEGKTGSARLVVRPTGAPAPAPVITALSPSQITAGWPGPFTLTITGANFTLGSRILWNGTPVETNYINVTELRTVVHPSDVTMPAQVEITVETPAPGGGSAERTFPVVLRSVSRVDVTSDVGTWSWVGDTMSLTAVARDLAGDAIPHWTFAWSSQHEEIASVNSQGLVTGVAKGQTAIRASAGGVTGLRSLAVYDAPGFDLVYDVGTNTERRIMLWTPGSPRRPISLTSAGDSYDPSPSPDGRRIAFTGVVNGNRDIYVIDRNGSGLARLTQGTSINDEPAWSPDGTKIAFRSTRSGAAEVWVMNADGSNQRRLTGPEEGWIFGEESFNPAWSPDSRFIVYAKREQSDVDLWVMNADGSARRRLTSGNAQDIEATWSPDGSQITFRRSSGASVFVQTVSAQNGVPVFGIVQATFGRAPSYSPDGKWLAYTATGETFGALMVMPGNGEDWPRIARTAESGGGNNVAWMRRP